MLQSHRSIFDPGIAHKNCLTNFRHRSRVVIPLPLYRLLNPTQVRIPQKKMFDKPTKAVYHTSMKQSTTPKNDGDFFYTGNTPAGESIVGIVQIITDPKGQRWAVVYIPPYWRGDMERSRPTCHFDKLENWTGEWSGPEFGLCCTTENINP